METIGPVRPSVTPAARRSGEPAPACPAADRSREARALGGLLVIVLGTGALLHRARESASHALAAELTSARDLSALALEEAASALAESTHTSKASAARALLASGEQPGLRTRYERGSGGSFELAAARVGASGESLVFDQDGLLLGPTRHRAELQAAGRLDRDGRLTLREPRGARSDTEPRAPLLAPVQAALGQEPRGVLLTAYPDARGVPSVGAYAFMPALGLGLLHQRDRSEALQLAWLSQLALVLAGLGAGGLWLARTGRAASEVPPGEPSPQQPGYGPYTLGRKLGEGGMGVVYEASHRLLRRPTAIKLLRASGESAKQRAESLGRFEREVQLTSQLNHPNTIVIYDYGETDDGTFYYAMEYVDGVDLERLVRLEGPLPPARIIHLALQICGSLAEAHGRGLIHRDIKPANILICERGGIPDFIKVLDFGLVKHVNGPAVSSSNLVVGTPLYMAPELLRAEGVAGPRSDIYALGAVLHWLATAMTVPDAALASAAILPRRPGESGRPLGDPYAGLPLDFERVLMRCIDSDPYERPASVDELAAELSACRDAGRWTTADARAYWATRSPQREALMARPVPGDARTVQAS